MARHIFVKISDWWNCYSLPILLVFTSVLLLGYRVEQSNDADLSTVSGFYGPGAVTAWLITAFSMFCSGSGQILFSKLQRFLKARKQDDDSYQEEPVALGIFRNWNELPESEKLNVYENLWPSERRNLRLWDSESVAVTSYAIIAYVHTTWETLWSKYDESFICSSQAVAAHNIIQLITFLAHVIVIVGHLQDHHPAGYDPRRGISTFFGTWHSFILHGAFLTSIWSMRYPSWMQVCHCLTFILPLLLEATRKGGAKIVVGSSIFPLYLSMFALIPLIMRLSGSVPKPCSGIKIVLGCPFPKSGATWTDLDQFAAIVAAVGALLYKTVKSGQIGKTKEAWMDWRHEAPGESAPILPVTTSALHGSTAPELQIELNPITRAKPNDPKILDRRHSFSL